MSERRTDREVERILDSWMGEVAPESAPARLLEETFSRTMTARQSVRYPWHRLTVTGLGPWPARSRIWLLLVLAAALLLVALSIGLPLGGPRNSIPIAPSPSPSIDACAPKPNASLSFAIIRCPTAPTPISVKAEKSIALPGPIAMATDGQVVWVLTGTGGLVRIDPATNAASAPVQLGAIGDLYNGLAVNAVGVWATDWDTQVVYRLDPGTMAIVARIPVVAPKGVLVTEDGVWVAQTHNGAVLRIDPATNAVVATVKVGPAGNSGPNWLGAGLGSIWTGIPNNASVARIDPVTNTVQASVTIPALATACGGIAVADAGVWMPSCDVSNWLTHIDPTTNTVVAIINMGGRGFSPLIINGAPWISVDRGSDPASILQIDPATNQFDRILSPGGSFRGGGDMAVAADSVWIIDGPNNQVLRLPLSAFGP